MTRRFLTIPAGRNLPKIRQSKPLNRRSSTKRRSRTLRAWWSRRAFWRADAPTQRRSRKGDAHARTHPPPLTPNGRIAGTSITATSMSGRSPGASAIRPRPTPGNGPAASIRAASQRNTATEPQRHLTRRVPTSGSHGRRFFRRGRKPIFRHGAMLATGTPGNTRSGRPASCYRRKGRIG